MSRVRVATPADVGAMLELAKCAVTAAHWSRERYEALFSAPMPRRLCLVVEERSAVHAFLIARTIGDEWEIENIAVAEPVQRRGLGTSLLGEFLNLIKAKGAKRVFLEVRESNHAARVLYEKAAFVETGRRKMYYQNPAEDAVVYQLAL